MAKLTTENHDVADITFDSRQADEKPLPSFLESPEAYKSQWDAAELGISYDAAVERFAQANTPEARQQVLDDLRSAAVERLGVTKVDGKLGVVVAGEAPWHNLGYRVDSAMTSEEVREICEPMRSTYEKLPLFAEIIEDGKGLVKHSVPGRFGVMMTSPNGNRKVLPSCAVSEEFTIVQIEESMAFLDGVMGASGARYDSAGIVADGAGIWLSILMPKVLEVVRGDTVFSYGLLTDRMDSKETWRFQAASVRTVCANTRRQAIASGIEGLVLRHSRTLKDRIAMALAAVESANNAFTSFGEFAELMAATQATPESYFDQVAEGMANDSMFSDQIATDELLLIGPEALLTETVGLERAQQIFKRRQANRVALMDTFRELESSPTNMASGTVWGAYNAVTQYANHHLRYTGTDTKRRETRMQDILTGRANRIDQLAYAVAQSVCA